LGEGGVESRSTHGRLPARKLLKLPPIVGAQSLSQSSEKVAAPFAQARDESGGGARGSAAVEDHAPTQMAGGGRVGGWGQSDSEDKLHVYVVASPPFQVTGPQPFPTFS